MTDSEKLWREACERAGLGEWRVEWREQQFLPLHKLYPPLGDDHATVVMLRWLVNLGIVHVLKEPFSNDYGVHVRIDHTGYYNGEGDNVPLAIAAAVVAIKENPT